MSQSVRKTRRAFPRGARHAMDSRLKRKRLAKCCGSTLRSEAPSVESKTCHENMPSGETKHRLTGGMAGSLFPGATPLIHTPRVGTTQHVHPCNQLPRLRVLWLSGRYTVARAVPAVAPPLARPLAPTPLDLKDTLSRPMW